MIDAARSLGLPATYTGSGGAIVGICDDPEKLAALATGDVQVTRATL